MKNLDLFEYETLKYWCSRQLNLDFDQSLF